MQELANTLIDKGTQCWACPLFDRLFEIISNTAGALYEQLTTFSIIIFCILFAFYIANVFWQNIKSDMKDPFLFETLKPVLIKSLFVMALLGMGLAVPRFISTITFEPAAAITLEYSKAMLPDEYKIPDDYQKIELGDNGFFNSELRDTVVKILQTSVTNFQVFIKVGIAIIDSAFSIPTIFNLSFLLKRLLVLFVGLFLTYNFVQLFIKYSCYFLDIIVAMAMFAFFFPLSLVFFVFQGASNLPDWMKNFGKGLGGAQIKKLIDAIVSVASAILIYTVIILIIRGYLNGHGINVDSIQNTAESIFDFNLDNPSAIQVTFFGTIVLVFVILYIAKKLPDVTKEIMKTFGVNQEDALSKDMGNNMWALTNIVADQTKNLVKTFINPDSKKDEKKEDKKDDKKTEIKK